MRSARGCACGETLAAPVGQDLAGDPSGLPPRLPGRGRETVWQLASFEAGIERRFRQLALPVALAGAWAMVHIGFARALLRIVFSMWTHELGHAAAAWLCGRLAWPGPWRTPVAEARSPFVIVVLAGLLSWGAVRLWRARRMWAMALLLLIPVQVYCSLVLSARGQRTFIVWAGDGGGMLIGTLLMLSFYARKHTQLRVGWLRWGFLVIGAAALADPVATWWAARGDPDMIPFGENQGCGPSDPTVLVFELGQSIRGLVHGYLAVATLCLLVLLLAYGLGLRRDADAD